VQSAISSSKIDIEGLLKTYESIETNNEQSLTEYIGGYCSRIMQYLNVLSTAYQTYNIFLMSNARNHAFLSSSDKEMSITYSKRQALLLDALNTFCEKTIPDNYPKCYKPIFEDKKFYLQWNDNSNSGNIFIADWKDGKYSECRYHSWESSKFKLTLLPDAKNKNFPWTLKIDDKDAYVLKDPKKHLPSAPKGPKKTREPLWVSCPSNEEKYKLFRLEHTKYGLRLNTILHSELPSKHYMMRTNALYSNNTDATIYWSNQKLDSSSSWSVWQVVRC
jgi:hypothetical protein